MLRNRKRGKQDVPDEVICQKHVSIREPSPAEGFSKIRYSPMPPTGDEIDEMKANPDAHDCISIMGQSWKTMF